MALNDAQWVRFYHQGRPIGDMRVTLETVQVGEAVSLLPSGDEVAAMRVGLEKENQTLKVSDNIRARQITTSLTRYNGLPVTDDLDLYVARLVSPQTPLNMLPLGEGVALYAALKHLLRLPDAPV